jgi:hypothetical protein
LCREAAHGFEGVFEALTNQIKSPVFPGVFDWNLAMALFLLTAIAFFRPSGTGGSRGACAGASKRRKPFREKIPDGIHVRGTRQKEDVMKIMARSAQSLEGGRQ